MRHADIQQCRECGVTFRCVIRTEQCTQCQQRQSQRKEEKEAA